MIEHEARGQQFSLKGLFSPLTTFKAIHFIVIIGLIVFFNSLFNNFVWDDITYILQNPETHVFDIIKVFNPSSFSNLALGYYQPIPTFYFTLFYVVFKESSFFYHFFQISFHITNTILLFILLKQFFRKNFSLILSLVFLVHPMQVESAAYIAQTINPLFFLFGITALLLSQKEEISFRRSVLISMFLLLSFLTQETGFLFLFTILLYGIIFKHKNLIFLTVSGVLATVSYFLMRFYVGHVYFARIEEMSIPISSLSLPERLINIPAIILYYLKTFFFPYRLVIDQQWVVRIINFNSFYFPLLIDGLFFSLLFFLGYFVYKHDEKLFRVFILFLFWFLVGLFMHLQIIPLDMTVADRWFYFPIVGLLGLIGVGLQTVGDKKKKLSKAVFVVALFVIFASSIRTIVRNMNWYDAITLYAHDLSIYENTQIENNLGDQYIKVKNYNEALKHFEKSVELSPRLVNLYNVGNTYEQLNDLKKAEEYYNFAIAVSKSTKNRAVCQNDLQYMYSGLGRVMLFSGRPTEVSEIAKKELKNCPDFGPLWILLAGSEYELHHQREALLAAEKAKNTIPGDRGEIVNSLYLPILNNQPIVINRYNGLIFIISP